MARYLSPEWVHAFDAALGALDLTDAIAAAGEGSLLAADGSFAVAQVVEGVPGEADGAGTGGAAAKSSDAPRSRPARLPPAEPVARRRAHRTHTPSGAPHK